MILLHRLRGQPLYLNADLIESVETTPDTVITLVDGRRVYVEEHPVDVVEGIRRFRASLLVTAEDLRDERETATLLDRSGLPSPATPSAAARSLSVVPDEEGGIDPMFLGGMALVFIGIIAAMMIDGNSLGPLIGPSSFLLVFTAAVGAGLMAYRTSELSMMPKSALKAIRAEVPDVQDTITQLARLAETARREGMLALEREMEEIDDRFLQLGVQMLVDGADEDVVRETLEIELAATDERHRTAIGFFKQLGGYAPTFGMVGTVIGLINMLGNLEDPGQLGRGMALALLTTLYGVLIANLLFNPIAARMERLNAAEMAVLDVALDGLLTIRRGASPRGIIERLEAYLPPSQRIGVGDRLKRDRSEAAA